MRSDFKLENRVIDAVIRGDRELIYAWLKRGVISRDYLNHIQYRVKRGWRGGYGHNERTAKVVGEIETIDPTGVITETSLVYDVSEHPTGTPNRNYLLIG